MAKKKRAKKIKFDTKQIAIVLLVAGIGLLVWGLQRYDTFGDELSRSLGGNEGTDKTMIIMIAGAISAGLGIYQLIRK